MATLVGGKRQGDYAMGDKVSRFFVSCVIGSGGGIRVVNTFPFMSLKKT